jgi:hypothetical protein
MVENYKEKKLRMYLDNFKKSLTDDWVTPLNPDNVKIEFKNFGNFCIAMSVGQKIILNSMYEADELFSSFVHELWHLKQKREAPIRYHIFLILFFRNKIEKSAEEWEAIAEDWIYYNK